MIMHMAFLFLGNHCFALPRAWVLCCNAERSLFWQLFGLVIITCRVYGFSIYLRYCNGTSEPTSKKETWTKESNFQCGHASRCNNDRASHWDSYINFYSLFKYAFMKYKCISYIYVYIIILEINYSTKKNISVFQFNQY